ncbi:hypothetical protein GCM10009624_31690 [Gordonia sinesedis]
MSRLVRVTAGAASIALVAMIGACESSVEAPLPRSEKIVDSDSPLTAQQATAVTDDARAATTSIIAAIGRGLQLSPEPDAAWEDWSGCTAKSGPFTFGTTHYNGVLYGSDITYTQGSPVDITAVHKVLEPLKIQWQSDNQSNGTLGIYRVSINSTSPLRVQLNSPCYFLRDIGSSDGGSITADEQAKTTGFVRQPWSDHE